MYLKIRKDGDEALYWNKDSGWVKWDNATIFESGASLKIEIKRNSILQDCEICKSKSKKDFHAGYEMKIKIASPEWFFLLREFTGEWRWSYPEYGNRHKGSVCIIFEDYEDYMYFKLKYG